jgi:large subunit ribosomal protein L17
MRHRKGGFKLQRDPSARRALLRGLTTSVILHERIETTVTKAKAVRPRVERVITLAKRDTLHARRQAAAYLFEPRAVKKLFDTIGPRFADRQGGYTRIMRLGTRSGDGAEIAILELLGAQLEKKAETKQQRRESRMSQESDAAADAGTEEIEAEDAGAEDSEAPETKEKS